MKSSISGQARTSGKNLKGGFCFLASLAACRLAINAGKVHFSMYNQQKKEH
ncbi:MAG: hypothetical protein LBU32_05720 [Clostridiales bacterium]|jgi:hypothetical protein|nr:hypothetical protein [Clostridiales bacterium]